MTPTARKLIEQVQRKTVEDALTRHEKLVDAAKEIGIGRTTLWRWMRRFKLKHETFSRRSAADETALRSPS